MGRKHNDDAGERGDRGAMNATDAAPNARVSDQGTAAVYVHIGSLRRHPRNPRRHGSEVAALARTILRTTWGAPIIAQASTRRIIGGHGRDEAAEMIAAGIEVDGVMRGGPDYYFDRNAPGPLMIPARFVDVSDAEADAMTLADNARALQGNDDSAAIVAMATASFERDAEVMRDMGYGAAELDALVKAAGDAIMRDAARGGDVPQGEDPGAAASVSLASRFIVPPFSVLDARQGYWQERKRAWLALGIESEVGRPSNALKHNLRPGADSSMGFVGSGTSIFDPVLCELAFRWFSPPAGGVLDPFAGGSVRGIVAAKLGRSYIGIDLRAEQTSANEEQARRITPGALPRWIMGDSRALPALVGDAAFDFVFSCPPYADLERYSDDPSDLSTMAWPEFRAAYRKIIAHAVALLRPDRFACFVVGDVRDKRGNYLNLPAETIDAFRAAGCELYNEAVLVTSIGTLPQRAGGMFTASRKLGKTHQNVLVFVKGDARKATEACGPVECGDVPESLD